MSEVLLRKGGAQDVRFLRDMLHHAYYWRERVPGSLVSRYVRGWGRPGDTALIALENGFPVGAAWFRLFAAAEPGYGFVDESTPELAIAVVPSKRGHGVGDDLLSPLYWGAIESTEEAIINALVGAETMVGRDGIIAHALPHDRLRAAIAQT